MLLLAFLKKCFEKNKLVNKLIILIEILLFLFIVRFYNDLNNMAAHVLFDASDTQARRKARRAGGALQKKGHLDLDLEGTHQNLKGTLPLLALQKLIRFVKQFIHRIFILV